jgi:hydroxyacylglutathione hydrolase
MGKGRIERLVLGTVSTNCYFLINEQTKEAVLVDPAAQQDLLVQEIEAKGLKLTGILLTHGHFDHILAVNQLRKEYAVAVYAHKEEDEILKSQKLNLSSLFGYPVTVEADIFLNSNEKVNLAGFEITVLHTPGHTKGSVCYYLKEEGVLFSGDTLFRESIGRSDFPTGDGDQLLSSIKESLWSLPQETVVYSGHGDQTDINHELHHNPFLR